MLENIRLSFQGIWSHKMRSLLTMLGIIIGIAAIISIVSTIKGTNEQIKQNLVGSGNNTVEIKLYQNDWEYESTYNGLPQGFPSSTRRLWTVSLKSKVLKALLSMLPETTLKVFITITRLLTAEKFMASITSIFLPAVIRCAKDAVSPTAIIKISERLPSWIRMQPTPFFRNRSDQ